MIAYSDSGNTGFGTAVVATATVGMTITYGALTVFESAPVDSISTTFDSTNNKVIIVYTDIGATDNGTAIVGTVSGCSSTWKSSLLGVTTMSWSTSCESPLIR